jgi:hypothetical protein
MAHSSTGRATLWSPELAGVVKPTKSVVPLQEVHIFAPCEPGGMAFNWAGEQHKESACPPTEVPRRASTHIFPADARSSSARTAVSSSSSMLCSFQPCSQARCCPLEPLLEPCRQRAHKAAQVAVHDVPQWFLTHMQLSVGTPPNVCITSAHSQSHSRTSCRHSCT